MKTKLGKNDIFIIDLSQSFYLQYYVDKKEDIKELIKEVTQDDIYDIVYDELIYSDEQVYLQYKYKEKNHYATNGFTEESITILKLSAFKYNIKTFNELEIVYVPSNSDLDTNLIYCSNEKDILTITTQFIDSENSKNEDYEINKTYKCVNYIEYTVSYTIFDKEEYYDEYNEKLGSDTYEKEYYVNIFKSLTPIKIKNRIKKFNL